MARRADAEVLAAFRAAAITADLVSFDLFDTLILRDVWRPEDMFECVARRLPPAAGAWFTAHREAAEHTARQVAGDREITLAAIYLQLQTILAATPAMMIDLDDVMALEIALEVNAIAPDAAACAVFRAVVAAGCIVILVSDMYLPRTAIEAMLARAGIAGHAALYLSSETGLTKAAGSVWPGIRADFGMPAEAEIIHLGDNMAADGAAASRQGITPFLLSPPDQRLPSHRYRPTGHPITDMCHALLRQALRSNPAADPYWLTLAYLVVAPAAIGMAGWIAAQAEQEGRRVFFLARDGRVFQIAYEAAWRAPDAAPSAYLWSSRRCLNIAAIEHPGETDLDFLCSGTTALRVGDYLRRVSLDPADPAIAAVVSRFFTGAQATVADEAARLRLRAMFAALAAPLSARASRERAALSAHLDHIGLFEEPALVVDLGWHGSLQRSLIRLARAATGREPDLAGAYLGTTAARPTDIDARGWLFADGRPDHVTAATVGASYEVIELLFSSPESGISHLTLADGAPQPVRLVQSEEQPRLDLAGLFHHAVGHVARAMRPHLVTDDIERLHAMALANITTLLGQPDATDAAKFAGVTHAEGFGAATYRPIVAPSPGFLRPWALDRAYRQAFWKRGYLASLDPVAWLTLRAISLGRKLYRPIASTRPPAQISAPPARIEPSGRVP